MNEERKGDRKGGKQKAGFYFPHILFQVMIYIVMEKLLARWGIGDSQNECGFFKWLSLLQDDRFYEIINSSMSN